MGLTVVGKEAATVITSSPGWRRSSPKVGDVNDERARRLAEEPELVRTVWSIPKRRENFNSKSFAKRPVVSQKSITASTPKAISFPSNTLPDAGIGVTPG